jgi:hypothetical protein
MFLKTKNRKALSAVLTTLIILVASVVLGTGVVLFGTSLFQTNAQSSGLAVEGIHVWVNATTGTVVPWAWGAAEIRNSGDKILSVDQISVRGTQIPFANWYVDNSARVTAGNFQSQLVYTGTGHTGTSPATVGMMTSTNATSLTNCQATTSTTAFAILEASTWSTSTPTLCFSQATGPISLAPGAKAIVYFQVPTGVLGTVDGGSASSVALYAGSVGSPQSVTVQSES